MKFLLTNWELNGLRKQAVEDYIASEENKIREIEIKLSQRENCAVYFNFNDPNISAFSIERLDFGTLSERTVIGYYLRAAASVNGADEKKVIKEWTIFCGRKQHNQLVEEFNKSKR